MGVSHRFVDTNGIRMHIAEEGEGPVVVLCHVRANASLTSGDQVRVPFNNCYVEHRTNH